MDTQHQTKAQPKGVAEQIADIKVAMPNVYASIQAKAADIGSTAYALVRRGLRGEPCCFYAFERGVVVGTPFQGHPISDEVARHMVQFGCAHVCIWADVPTPRRNEEKTFTES